MIFTYLLIVIGYLAIALASTIFYAWVDPEELFLVPSLGLLWPIVNVLILLVTIAAGFSILARKTSSFVLKSRDYAKQRHL